MTTFYLSGLLHLRPAEPGDGPDYMVYPIVWTALGQSDVNAAGGVGQLHLWRQQPPARRHRHWQQWGVHRQLRCGRRHDLSGAYEQCDVQRRADGGDAGVRRRATAGPLADHAVGANRADDIRLRWGRPAH